MLRAALTIAQLPAKATASALKQATSPAAIQALSSAIAKGSFNALEEEGMVIGEGATITIEYDQDRLLGTAGFATAVSLGTVYWLGSRLDMKFRYASMITALGDLNQAISTGDLVKAQDQLKIIDQISNPRIDPKTSLAYSNADEVAEIYETVFARKAEPGSMFKAGSFTSKIDDSIKIGSRASLLIAREGSEEAIEAMVKKAAPIAGKLGSRVVGAVLWVDTVWWLATSAIDVGLNYLGSDEEDQRIPILADIPLIGFLFDFSDSLGSSVVDEILSPIIEGTLNLIFGEDEVQVLVDSLWAIITSAALNPSLAPFTIAILDFYIEDVRVDFTVPITFDLLSGKIDSPLDLFKLRPDPMDILILWLYAITAKIFWRAWLVPSYRYLITQTSR